MPEWFLAICGTSVIGDLCDGCDLTCYCLSHVRASDRIRRLGVPDRFSGNLDDNERAWRLMDYHEILELIHRLIVSDLGIPITVDAELRRTKSASLCRRGSGAHKKDDPSSALGLQLVLRQVHIWRGW